MRKLDSDVAKNMSDCAVACPVQASLEIVSGKGKGLILFHLLHETLRFNELKRRIAGISQRMLTKQLRELERDGLVNRKIYPEVPPKVEYSLTESGKTLEPILIGLREWGVEHAFGILEQREVATVGKT